jgi:hypothetical protein
MLRIRIPPIDESEFDSDDDSDSDTGMSEEMSPATLPSETQIIHRPTLCSNLCILRQVHQFILLLATVLFAILLYHV